MKINFEEISCVVQGPVSAYRGRGQGEHVTGACLASIRQHLPGATIVLSTWKDQDLSGLDYDDLIELDDPGANSIFVNGREVKRNNNRQLKSTYQGLQQVSTPYAIKLRSDICLTHANFVQIYEHYALAHRDANQQYFKQRILSTSAFSVRTLGAQKTAFYKSDLFDFGLTEDLIKIWPDKLIGELRFNPRLGYKNSEPATEQFLTLHWLSALLEENLFMHNRTCDDAGLGQMFWQGFVENNLLFAKPTDLGLALPQRLNRRGHLTHELTLGDCVRLIGFEGIHYQTLVLRRKINNLVHLIKRLYVNRFVY